MDKMIKTVVLMAIIVGAAVGIWVYTKQPEKSPGPATPTLESGKPKQAPPRVEEKYGVTSEGVGGG